MEEVEMEVRDFCSYQALIFFFLFSSTFISFLSVCHMLVLTHGQYGKLLVLAGWLG